MSRLDSAINRLMAQRDCLAMAAGMIADVPGPLLEIGLGNGRTYDHLRELLPERDIFVFERQVAAHPDCIPPPERLLLGDLRETLPGAFERIGAGAALIHADIGCGDPAVDAETASVLADWLPALMSSDGVVLTDQRIETSGMIEQGLPDSVKPGRYFCYRSRTR